MQRYHRHMFVVSFVALMIFPTALYAQGLSLAIELDKNGFIEGEPIYAVLTLTNASSEVQNCPRFYLEIRVLDLDVKGPDGKSVRYSGARFEYLNYSQPFEPLQPHASRRYICSLIQFYHNFLEKGAGFPYDIVARLTPGAYSVTAHYTWDQRDVVSNTLAFTVSPPQGEEAVLFDTLKIKFQIAHILDKNQDEKISTLKALAEKYKNSNYRTLLYQYIGYYSYQKGDTVQAKEINKTLIKEYPNTGYALKILEWLKHNRKEEFLDELKWIAPDSRAAKYGAYLLTQ